MAKPKKDPSSANGPHCAPMFREDYCFGEGASHNSHSAADYEPRYPRHDEFTGIDTAGNPATAEFDEGIAGGVSRQVMNQMGNRNGTMSFKSLIGREKR